MTDPTSTPGSIVVSGTGRVAVEPDVADLRLGVAISRGTVAEARSAAAAAMTSILAAIEAAGVARRDTRTTLLSVQPRYDYRDGQAPALVGYDLANVVEVTIRDLAALGAVVDGALGAGATSLDGLAFRVEDPSDAEKAARTAAVAQARARAEVLASAADVRLAGVVGHRRGWRAAGVADAEGRPAHDGRRRVDPDRGGHDRDRGDGHRHVPDRLTAAARPATQRPGADSRSSSPEPRLVA